MRLCFAVAIVWAALPTAVQATVNVTDLGAKGDGVADDTRAIQAALDTGQNVVIPAGTFRITNALRPKAGQVVKVVGTIRVADSHIQPLTADAAAGQSRLQTADASGYYVGQWITVGDDSLPIQQGGKKVRRQGADCGRIAAIETNTLVLEFPLRNSYTVAAKARLGTQHSAFLITQSGVRIHGTGVIDGNKANQVNFAPADMTASKGRGEETRAGCGISIDSDPEPISHLRIEGVTIRDAILHNVSLYRARHALVSRVTSSGAHDKNILLRLSEDCQILDNQCLDSEYEDGIIIYSGNNHCLVHGNICARNARFGICVNAFQTGILLSGNICRENPANLSLRGDFCSSTGDFCSGRGGVLIEGHGNQVTGLISLCAVDISATDLTYSGGIISGTSEKPLACALTIHRKTDDRRTALIDGVRIREVTIKNCATAVTVAGTVRDVRLTENRIQSKSEPLVIAPECKEEVILDRNEIATPLKKDSKGTAE